MQQIETMINHISILLQNTVTYILESVSSSALRYWSKDQVQELFYALGISGKSPGVKKFC